MITFLSKLLQLYYSFVTSVDFFSPYGIMISTGAHLIYTAFHYPILSDIIPPDTLYPMPPISKVQALFFAAPEFLHRSIIGGNFRKRVDIMDINGV